MSAPEPIQSDCLLHEVHAREINPSLISISQLHDRCFNWLSLEERATWERFSTATLRHDYLAARVLCRGSLSRYARVKPQEWRFERSAHGKPFISEPPEFRNLSFNLTHTRDLAVCVISAGREVGVDAEEIRASLDIADIERQFFSDQDRDDLQHFAGQARIDRFFETWVLKESYLKGCGIGLSRDPGSFTIPRSVDSNVISFDGWQLSLHRPSAKHVVAVTVQSGGQRILVRWPRSIPPDSA